MRLQIEKADLMARIAPSLVGLVALAVVAALAVSGEHLLYNRLLAAWGFVPFRFPFVDIDGSLAAWDCSRKGVNVIISNPCDVLARGYNYSPFWMTIDWIPLGRPDRAWVGVALGVAFLASLSALPPAVSAAEFAVRLAAVLSTMVAFAIERANPDLLIFMLAIGAVSLLRRSTIAKALGYCVIFLAGAIKYYPFALLGLVAWERLRLGIVIAVTCLGALAAFYFVYAGQIHEGLPHIVKGIPFGDMFGLENLPFGMFMVFQNFNALPIDPVKGAMITMVLAGATVFWVMIRLMRTSDIPSALGRLDEARRLTLLAGALLLSGCFFAGQSIAYRGIFLFLVIPGLSALARDRNAGTIASASRLAMIGIPFLMWAEAIRFWIHLVISGTYPAAGFRTIPTLQEPWDFLAWFVREVGWWFLIWGLMTILISDLAVRPLRYIQEARLLLRPKA